jgi:hypothetical protein
MKPMCKILNLGHVFALLPDSHHFTFRRRLFIRFQELSIIVLIRSIILAVKGKLQLWVPAKLPSGKQEDKMKRLMKRAQLIDALEIATSSVEDNVTDISMLLTRPRNNDSNLP